MRNLLRGAITFSACIAVVALVLWLSGRARRVATVVLCVVLLPDLIGSFVKLWGVARYRDLNYSVPNYFRWINDRQYVSNPSSRVRRAVRARRLSGIWQASRL